MRRFLLLSALVLGACTPTSVPVTDGAVTGSASSSVAPSMPQSAPAEEGMRKNDAMPASSGTMADDDGGKNDGAMGDDATEKGVYVTGIIDAQLQDGATKVLFFHAGWCPYCKAHDQALQGWYAAGNVALSTHKIDFDSSLELRGRYGVVQQDTFVLVDGSGTKLQELTGFPSNASIQAMIGSR